jgi:hypothetical protein
VTDKERAMWAALCVTLTGMMTALAALRSGDLISCDQALESALESGGMFTDRLQGLMGPDPNESRGDG